MAKAPSTGTKAKGGRPDTSNMTKAQKFAFLANARMTKLLAGFENLERLANARNYEFTPEQVARMNTRLSDRVTKLRSAFDNALKGGTTSTGKPTFDINAD